MSTKVRFNKSSFLVSLLLFFLCTRQLSAANVLGRPRKMYLIKTEHFDIVYSNQSEETALLLVQNADALYKKAAGELEAAGYQGFPLKLHMPVIISPDSDLLFCSLCATLIAAGALEAGILHLAVELNLRLCT